MKKFLYLLLITGLCLTSFKLLSAIYPNELFNFAIQFEQSRANLYPAKSHIKNQDYYYLSRPHATQTETVVLLHGFSANKENWLRFSQNLPEHYQIYALDLLGHGMHEMDLSLNYSIETQVDYLHDFVSETLTQPFHLVGNSMGGAVAALYSATYPEMIKSLLLISPAGVHEIPSDMDNMIEKGSNPLIADSVEQFNYVLDFVMEDPPFIPDVIMNIQAEKSVARYDLNKKIFSDIRNDLSKQLEHRFTSIQSPTYILWGQQDRVINVENIHRYSALIKDSQYQALEGIGHLAMLEDPQLTANIFLNLAKQAQGKQP